MLEQDLIDCGTGQDSQVVVLLLSLRDEVGSRRTNALMDSSWYMAATLGNLAGSE